MDISNCRSLLCFIQISCQCAYLNRVEKFPRTDVNVCPVISVKENQDFYAYLLFIISLWFFTIIGDT